MYNKYFTMKKSQLKEAIKAEIKSVLLEELEKFQMTYKGDPVHIKVQGFGGNAEGPKDKILFVNIGDMGKRHISTQNALEKRLGLLDQEVTGIMFTDKDNTSKEIKDISKDDFKITSVLSEDFNEPLMKMIGLKEVYQTNSKMSQMVSLFQEMMADEYDGIEVPKAFDDFVPKFFEAINMDYESAENFGEKVSNIREEDEEPLMKMIGLKEGKKGVVVDPDEIMMHINQYQSGNIDGDDLAQAIEEILVAMMNKSVTFADIREDEMTDAEKKKAAEKDAKKEKDFANKQKEVDKLKKELADNKDELVKIAKISRNERTKAQQNLLDDMAKKTKELKKLRRVEA